MGGQPRGGGAVVETVAGTRHELNAVAEGAGTLAPSGGKLFGRHLREAVAAELGVELPREERKADVLAVVDGCVHQWLATGHRTRGRPVVGIVGGQTLRAVSALGDAEDVEAQGVDVGRSEGVLQQLLPCPLFRGLIPAVPRTGAGNAGNEIDRGIVCKS